MQKRNLSPSSSSMVAVTVMTFTLQVLELSSHAQTNLHTFVDDFNRPDSSSVGNNWTSYGNTFIRGNQLNSTGLLNVGGGIWREDMPIGNHQVSFSASVSASTATIFQWRFVFGSNTSATNAASASGSTNAVVFSYNLGTGYGGSWMSAVVQGRSTGNVSVPSAPANTAVKVGATLNPDLSGSIFVDYGLNIVTWSWPSSTNRSPFGPYTIAGHWSGLTVTYKVDDFTLTTAEVAPQMITNLTVLGTNLVGSGIGETAKATYYVLNSTNVTLPVADWARVGTNQADGAGRFTFTNSFDSSVPQTFYRTLLR